MNPLPALLPETLPLRAQRQWPLHLCSPQTLQGPQSTTDSPLPSLLSLQLPPLRGPRHLKPLLLPMTASWNTKTFEKADRQSHDEGGSGSNFWTKVFICCSEVPLLLQAQSKSLLVETRLEREACKSVECPSERTGEQWLGLVLPEILVNEVSACSV